MRQASLVDHIENLSVEIHRWRLELDPARAVRRFYMMGPGIEGPNSYPAMRV